MISQSEFNESLTSESPGDMEENINLLFVGRIFDGPRGEALSEAFSESVSERLEGMSVSCRYLRDVIALVETVKRPDGKISGREALPGHNILVSSSQLMNEFMEEHLFYDAHANDSVSDEQLQDVARALHDAAASVLILASPEHASLVTQAMNIGRALDIAVDSLLDSTPDELIVQKLQSLVATSVQNQAMLKQSQLVEETNNHLIREQEVAKAVFEKVASEHRIDLPCVKQWLSPIAVFNGDVFMAAPTPNQDLLVLLGDFTGHGLGAALGAIPLASTFYRMAGKGFAPKEIIVEINKRLHDSLPTGFFCCALIAKIDFKSQSLEYLNAGLPDCYWLKQKNGELQPLVSSALPLGILSPSQFDAELHRQSISIGDSLFMLSDGLLETENNHGEAFGTHRMVKAINTEYLKGRENGERCDFMGAIQSSVREFRGGSERFDDISFAEIEIVDFKDFQESYSAHVDAEIQGPADWSLNYRFGASSLKNRDPVPHILNLLLEEPGLREHAGTVFSIVSELYNNALDHGVLELDSALKAGQSGFAHYYEKRSKELDELDEGQVSFEISYEACAETGCLKITVEDSGQGFDWYHKVNKASVQPEMDAMEVDSPDVSLTHGRGIPLLRQLCDHISYSGRGNVVKAIFSWDKFAEDQLEQKKSPDRLQGFLPF